MSRGRSISFFDYEENSQISPSSFGSYLQEPSSPPGSTSILLVQRDQHLWAGPDRAIRDGSAAPNAELERLLSIIRTVLTRGPVSSLEALSPLTEDDVPVAGDLVPHDRPVEPFVLPGAEDILVIEDVGLRSNGLWSSRPLPGGAARGNYRPM